MIPWKLWYDEVNPFKTFVGDWTKGDIHGVICCTVLDKTGQFGRYVNSGYAPHHDRQPIEFFVCYPDSDEPFVTWNLDPFLDRMAATFPDLDPDLYIKFGRQTDQLNWQEIMNAAAADTDFPTATSPRRRSSDFPSV